MAKDDQSKETHECVYLGDHDLDVMQPLEQVPAPPSAAFAKQVALTVLCGSRGAYRPTIHCSGRMKKREFDVFDFQYAIQNGECVEDGKYCAEHEDFQYCFRGEVDGQMFDAVFALCAKHDLINSPLLKLISGCWKNKSGTKRSRF